MALDITSYEIGKKSAGGSGTTDYTELSNKPSINDVTLTGNKTSSDLKLQSEIDSNNKLNADLVDDTSSTNKFVTSTEKTTWNGKQDVMQYSTVPTAGADTVGKIIQYTGTTDSNYTNGYFYKGISTTEGNETTYSWSNVGVQDLSGKQDTLTFDTTPTQNSTNPVTSNGIYEALSSAGGGLQKVFYNTQQTEFYLVNKDPGEYYFPAGNKTTFFPVYFDNQGTYWSYANNTIYKIVLLKRYNEKSDLDDNQYFAYIVTKRSDNLYIDYIYQEKTWNPGSGIWSYSIKQTSVLVGSMV